MPIEIKDGNAEITCDDCGKPLTRTSKYGMFCEDLCGYAESVEAAQKVEGMIKNLLGKDGE